MSYPYYNYSKQIAGDGADSLIGEKASKLGETLLFQDARQPDSNNVTFLAFVSSFAQSFSSNWNETEALGRMDNIATFKNTTRSISVTWDIPAPDAQTAEENLNRCNALIAMLYPSYTDRGSSPDSTSYVMSKPPLVRIKYANLICGPKGNGGLLGYITSLSWTPVLEMGSFHTDVGSANPKIFPRTISISIEFTVLHEAFPGSTASPTGFYPDNKGLRTQTRYKTNSAAIRGGGWPFGGISVPSTREED